MPANLTPQYFEAERRYRRAATPHEKIEALEEMLSVMPKHKGTDKLRAELRTKIAKLSAEAQKRPQIGKKGSLLYHVPKEGAAQAILLGFPNAGKSQILSAVTDAAPNVADYPFTTQMPIPGMMRYEDIQIQLVDVPAVNAPQVDSWLGNLVRNADILLLVIDLGEEAVLQLEGILQWLEGFRVVLEEPAGDEFRTRRKKVLVIGNKVDLPGAAENYRRLTSAYPQLPAVSLSAGGGEGLADLGPALYRALEVMRVYTKAPGQKADMMDPVVMPLGSTVEEVAASVHKDFAARLKFAQVWGSSKFEGQKVNKQYVLQEGDIVELHI